MANVLISGCSKGIGMATALELGRNGHTVHATMRSPERYPELQKLASAEELPIIVRQMDVDSDSSVSAAITAIQSEAKFIDVLVNNAGIERRGSVEELPLSEFRAVMETNYFGALRCTQAVLPAMRAARKGCIVNVTSVAGKISTTPLGPYAASKFALEALSEALAQEVKPFGIQVAIVQPGIIDTHMARSIATGNEESKYPQVRRFGNMFEASLKNPVPPSLVAAKIREIIESGTQKLRHPVGPDSEPFLAWRGSLSDEQWVEWGAQDDDAWFDRLQQDFGLDARP